MWPFPAPSYKTLKVSKPSCAVQAQEAGRRESLKIVKWLVMRWKGWCCCHKARFYVRKMAKKVRRLAMGHIPYTQISSNKFATERRQRNQRNQRSKESKDKKHKKDKKRKSKGKEGKDDGSDSSDCGNAIPSHFGWLNKLFSPLKNLQYHVEWMSGGVLGFQRIEVSSSLGLSVWIKSCG